MKQAVNLLFAVRMFNVTLDVNRSSLLGRVGVRLVRYASASSPRRLALSGRGFGLALLPTNHPLVRSA